MFHHDLHLFSSNERSLVWTGTASIGGSLMRSQCAVGFLTSSALVLFGCTSEETPNDASGVPSSTVGSTSAGSETLELVDPDQMVRNLDDLFGADPVYPTVLSVLVSQHGELVVERYYTKDAARAHDIASVTKSVVGTLVGIAVDGGLLALDQKLEDLLPEYAPAMSTEVGEVTLEQLLTMTAGFPVDPDPGEGDLPFLSGFGRAHAARDRGDDWVGQILQDAAAGPAGDFGYSSATSHVLAAIMIEAVDRPLLEYAEEKLFAPLGINTAGIATPLLDERNRRSYDRASVAWPVDPNGVQVGWGHLKLRPRDLLRLGELYLDNGAWQGEAVVSSEWVADATRNHLEILDVSGYGYGYQWWTSEAGGRPAAVALGFGGQVIEVVPDHDLVMVATSTISLPPVLDGGHLQEAINDALFAQP